MGTQLKAHEDWRPFSLAHFGGEGLASLFIMCLGVAVMLGKDFMNVGELSSWNDELSEHQ